MNVKFNFNSYIKVKLTDLGYRILKRRHEAVRADIMKASDNNYDIGKLILPTDEQGYTKFQAWKLIEEFGNDMGGFQPLVFEMDVIITDCEPVE